MNKREKAIWKLVTFLSLFLIFYFTYSSVQDLNQLNRNIHGFNFSEDKNKKNNMGMIDYIYEFEKYPGSLDKKYVTQKRMLDVIESYGLDSKKILKETQKGYRNTETKMYKHGFIETYSNPKSKTKNSTVYGFSLIDSSINRGEFFLTEIKGSVSSSCKSGVKMRNIFIKENGFTIGMPLNSIKSSNQYSCDSRKDIDVNKLCLKSNGEVWYSFNDIVYGFEFNLDYKNNKYSFSDDILNNYFILQDESGKIIGIPKEDRFIKRGIGLFLKFQESDSIYDLFDINLFDQGNLYDKSYLDTFIPVDKDIMTYNNYFYTKLNSDQNLEIYLSTNNEFDEYGFEVSCFQCAINNNEKNLNELEIIRAKLKERNFYFELETNDPSDLTNIVIFDGQDGYNQGKRLRAVIPTNITIDQSGLGKPIGLAEYQGQTYTVTLGDTIGGYEIMQMNQKYFLGKNLQSTNVDTLRYKKVN